MPTVIRWPALATVSLFVLALALVSKGALGDKDGLLSEQAPAEEIRPPFELKREMLERGLQEAIPVLVDNGVTRLSDFLSLDIEDFAEMPFKRGHRKLLLKWWNSLTHSEHRLGERKKWIHKVSRMRTTTTTPPTTDTARQADWGDTQYARCVQPYSWTELRRGYKDMNSTMMSTFFKIGGLGNLVEENGYETWQCFKGHYCAVDPDDPWFCFVYHETNQVFTPWGENSRLNLVRGSVLTFKQGTVCTCDKGYTGPEGGMCVQCEAGKYKNVPGSGLCMPCDKGEECTTPPCVSCTLCKPGYYKSEEGTHVCTVCPANTYRETHGANELGDCIPCPALSSSPSGSTEAAACEAKTRFFDVSVVKYPSNYNYSYPGMYETRILKPLPNTPLGTLTFSMINISNPFSSDEYYDHYSGAVLGPDGLIYFVPSDSENIGVLDPVTQSFTNISILDVQPGNFRKWKYVGGVLGPNGLIYFVPYVSDVIGVLDPATKMFRTLNMPHAVSSTLYRGGVLGPDGLIYFVPWQWKKDRIGVLNLVTEVFTTIDISGTSTSDQKYHGGVLAPDGLIYFAPFDEDFVGVLNPYTQNFTKIDMTISGVRQWCSACYKGAVLGPDGLIYFVPYFKTNIGVVNPVTKTFTTIDITSQVGYRPSYSGGVLGPDGFIYFLPGPPSDIHNPHRDHIGVLNPATQTFTTIDIPGISFESWRLGYGRGGVLGPNNKVYMVPNGPGNNIIGVLDLSNEDPAYEVTGGVPEAWSALLSPYFNKY